jgi:SAM-dependent methyltransferase
VSAAPETNEWANRDHAEAYLERAQRMPRREVAYGELMEILPPNPRRILDLGCGDGKVMAMIGGSGVAVDFSPHMLEQARARFHADDVEVVGHNLNAPLPNLGTSASNQEASSPTSSTLPRRPSGSTPISSS